MSLPPRAQEAKAVLSVVCPLACQPQTLKSANWFRCLGINTNYGDTCRITNSCQKEGKYCDLYKVRFWIRPLFPLSFLSRDNGIILTLSLNRELRITMASPPSWALVRMESVVSLLDPLVKWLCEIELWTSFKDWGNRKQKEGRKEDEKKRSALRMCGTNSFSYTYLAESYTMYLVRLDRWRDTHSFYTKSRSQYPSWSHASTRS